MQKLLKVSEVIIKIFNEMYIKKVNDSHNDFSYT